MMLNQTRSHYSAMKFSKTIICCGLLFTICCCADTEVQLLIKKNAIEENRVKFSADRVNANSSFTQFLEETQVIVDRTPFINYIMNTMITSEKAFAVTAPPGWGKTVMLKMIDFFFSPELDKNLMKIATKETRAYNYFEKGELTVNDQLLKFNDTPLISSNKTKRVLDTYIAQHPVVSLDFTNLYHSGDSLEDVARKFWIHVHDHTIQKHIDVINRLCSVRKNVDGVRVHDYNELKEDCSTFYDTYRTKPADVLPEQMEFIIAQLIDLLYAFYQKQIIMLVDGYERILHDLYIATKESAPVSWSVVQSIEDFHWIVLSMFITNVRTQQTSGLLFVLLTGVVPVDFPAGLTSISFCNFMDEEVYPFYGLQHEIGMQLMELAGFDDAMKKQHIVNFGHYETPSNPGVTSFNPWSLLQTISKSGETFPWCQKTSISVVKLVTKRNEYIRNDLQNLTLGRCLHYGHTLEITFSTEDLSSIGRKVFSSKVGGEIRFIFLKYLVQMGFLTVTSRKNYLSTKLNYTFGNYGDEGFNETELCARIPNLENNLLISKVLVDYDISHSIIFETSSILARMLYNHSITYDEFRGNFETFLRMRENNKIRSFDEFYYHTSLLVKMVLILKTTHNYKDLVKYQLNENRSIPDIVLHNGTHGGIFVVKNNVHPVVFDRVYDEQLPEYGTVFHKAYPDVRFLRLIVINVNDNEADKKINVTVRERHLNKPLDFEELEKIYRRHKKMKSGS